MELIKTKGLVLRSVNIGDYDKMLTVLSEEMGKMSVLAKGAKSLKHGGNSNVFCYNDFVLYAKGDIYVVSQSNIIESFFGLSRDLSSLNCGANFVGFVDFICQEQQEAGDVLRITLNSLYALAALHKNPAQVSVAFYLKMLNILGYEPEIFCCSACGGEENLDYFSASSGGAVCSECAPNIPDKKKIPLYCLKLMQYINMCDIKQLFNFDAGEELLLQVYEIISSFLQEHMDYKPKHEILKNE